MSKENVFDWLKNYFNNPQLNEQALNPILHFSLIWNLFEHTYLTDKNQLNTEKLLTLSDLSWSNLSEEILNKSFDFFKERYFHQNTMKVQFLHLGLENKSKKKLSQFDYCQNILKSEKPTNADKTRTIFLIIHRFRNNLFHGNKGTNTLNVYEQPFKKINIFLMHFIETTSAIDKINKNRFSNLRANNP